MGNISKKVAAYGQFVLVLHRLIRFCRSFINYNKNNNRAAFQYCFDYIIMTFYAVKILCIYYF